jgi:hypothetical protein
MGSEFGDGNKELVCEGNDESGWTIPLCGRPPEEERLAKEVEVKLYQFLL